MSLYPSLRRLTAFIVSSISHNTHLPPARRSLHRTTAIMTDVLAGLDDIQVKLMEEECILVDRDDKRIGHASKKACHLLDNINEGMLHRAFSVFQFNNKGELLLQQRANEKITFPGHWTNTCCSHPLHTPGELEEEEAVGVRRAAQRKLNQELGITADQAPVSEFTYLTRIQYQSRNVPEDGRWGEHEVDYILFAQRDVELKPNPNEVQATQYVSKEQLQEFMARSQAEGTLITPWFRLIVDKFLYKWWDHLDNLKSQADRSSIHRMS